jgi:hypothetical protein
VNPLAHYRRVWVIDFEFHAPAGERPKPICFVARDVLNGDVVRQWLWDDPTNSPPFAVGPDSLSVCWYASAEWGCFLARGWALPVRTIDLFAEFRLATAGLPVPCGHGLLGALAYYGLDGIAPAEKEGMRGLAIRGGPFTDDERIALLRYCESDVNATAELLAVMLPAVDFPRALLRGRYTIAVARMEWNGTPIDTEMLTQLRTNWDAIKSQLIGEVNQDYGVYVDGSFSAKRWGEWLARHGIAWPQLESGALALDDDTFREMARAFPAKVGPIRELRHAVSQLRLNELAVGSDGRNRCLLSMFGTRTSRNSPSNSRFIFGPSTWLRSLIRPNPGRAVAYCDYCQQELAIAAALSGDRRMQEAYASGDFYLTFAKMAGAVPADGTKQSHGCVRDQFKTVALGVLYGLSAEGLARKLAVAPIHGRELLRLHRETFRTFWSWSGAIQDQAMLTGRLSSVFGWTIHVGPDVNPRSLRNFPMQCNGAEMLRLACCLTTEAGITVCAPIHDALLVESSADKIEETVVATQKAMRDASTFVLPDFPLRTDAKIVRLPERYSDDRGAGMWHTVNRLLSAITETKSDSALVGGGEYPGVGRGRYPQWVGVGTPRGVGVGTRGCP